MIERTSFIQIDEILQITIWITYTCLCVLAHSYTETEMDGVLWYKQQPA